MKGRNQAQRVCDISPKADLFPKSTEKAGISSLELSFFRSVLRADKWEEKQP